MLKFLQFSFLLVVTVAFVGCGGSSETSKPEGGEIDRYLQENPEADVSMDELYKSIPESE